MPAKARRSARASAAGSFVWRDDARVAVRMYCGFLGDSFLLRFRGERDVFMLIDCGAFLGSPGEQARMRAVAEDVKATTAGRLDVVVITHEHWDHLCGFHHAGDVFDAIDIHELWLGWTEDPADAAAAELRKRRTAALRVVEAASAHAATPATARSAMDAALGFAGFGAAGRATTGDILAAMTRRAKKRVRYMSPGCEPARFEGVDATRVHVLGPPRDPALLLRSDPTRKGREVYELAGAADGDREFLAAALPGADDAAVEVGMPFDRSRRRPIEELRTPPEDPPSWLAALADAYADPDESWRRVDGDWLGAAETLALKLDGDTNNTSLALAIELTPGGRTLLFPGDAQVGNWLSWAGYRHPATGEAITTRDALLAQTVFYKVGHHGSHNATLRADGLEKMTSPDLMAFIPVDEAFARGTKRWNMPFPALERRLVERCGGNILRADRTAAETQDAKDAGERPRANAAFDQALFSAGAAPFIEVQL